MHEEEAKLRTAFASHTHLAHASLMLGVELRLARQPCYCIRVLEGCCFGTQSSFVATGSRLQL